MSETYNHWNQVLNVFILLKARFLECFEEEKLWDYGVHSNCIDYWRSLVPGEYEFECFDELIITEFNDFVLIRYSNLSGESEFWERYCKFYRECRSVVIDKKNDCLVLTPFRKFFNLNEIEETQEHLIRRMIHNAKDIEITDKMDGSMQSARFYNGEIVLAGSMGLDPESAFRVAIGYSLLTEEYQKMLKDNPDYTFIFELIAKEDPHVVDYPEEDRGLYLLGMRNVLTGEELSYKRVIQTAKHYGVKHTKAFDKTFDEVLSSLDDVPSNKAEGYVISIDGYKIKVKYHSFRKIHHLISNLVSHNRVIECISDGTWDDVKTLIPLAYQKRTQAIEENIFAYIRLMKKEVEAGYNDCLMNVSKENGQLNRKEFAIYANKHHKKVFAYLMNRFDNKENNFLQSSSGRYTSYQEITKKVQSGE